MEPQAGVRAWIAGPSVFSASSALTTPTVQEKAPAALRTAQSCTRSSARSARPPSAARTPQSSVPGRTMTAQ